MTTDSSSYYPEKTELDRVLDRLAELERERNTLYEAMREVCHAIGGYTTDGTSVEFLTYIPESVRLTIGKLERELAEARKDGARLDWHLWSIEHEGLDIDGWYDYADPEALDADEKDETLAAWRKYIDAKMGGE